MSDLGCHIRQKALPQVLNSVGSYNHMASMNWGWWPIHEPFSGAWQRNITQDTTENILAFSAVYACVTGIAADIGKMRIKLDRNNNGIWEEITAGSPWLPVLRKPNHYQTRIKFLEQWIVSKLLYGNAYVLKQRQDRRGLVTALYVLDPRRVTPLVADNGDVYYRLKRDPLSRLDEEEEVVVPASEIIHDTMVALWHPLIGVSPIFACGMSATMGNRIQSNSTNFFANASRVSGILTAPGRISDETAERLRTKWEEKYSGRNVGGIAVLGDGLKFEEMTMSSVDSQLIEQLRWTVEDVGRAFHYPLFKLMGPLPPYASNLEALNLGYYTDCLQPHIESMELSLDEGLDLPADQGTELDLDNLIRMDTTALFTSNATAVGGGFMSPNEARFRANLPPVTGGNTPFLQQQMWSLEQLSKRSGPDDAADAVVPPAPPATPEPEPEEERSFDVEMFEAELRKELCLS